MPGFKLTIIGILTLAALIAIGQQENRPVKQYDIGITFSPNYSFRDLNYSSTNHWIEEMRNENEVPKFGYSAGINLRYRIRNDVKLETVVLRRQR